MANSSGSAVLTIFSKLSSFRNKRYVNRFVLINETHESGRKELRTAEEKKALTYLEESIANYKKMVEIYPVLKEINQTILIVVKDLDAVKFTLKLADGEAQLQVGWASEVRPDMIIPLFTHNLKHLKDITAKKQIELDDIYRFIRVLFIPFLKGLYQADYSNLPKDKSYLQLDNFIHVEVKNNSGIEVEGFEGPAQATIVNVDGQWLVFPGFQGDPDVKYSMDVQQALEFAYLVKVKFLQHAATDNFMKLMPYVARYNALKKQTQVYERNWHNIEELK